MSKDHRSPSRCKTGLFEDLDTPCLLVDRRILEANLARMARLALESGVALRPHAKTHKCAEIAHRQVNSGAVGLTLAKVSEAEVMADAGIPDIFIAYPIVGEKKLRRLVELSKRCKISVGVDSMEGALGLNEAFNCSPARLPVLLEVDTGLRRTGVPLDVVCRLAGEIARMPHLRLKGIYTFRGALLGAASAVPGEGLSKAVEDLGRKEGEVMAKLAGELRKVGLGIEVVSAGSTPTAKGVASVPGVTEIRPGTYVFNDAMQVQLGVCTWRDCACKLLVTVVSRPRPDLAIIDGGSKVFAGDTKPDSPPLNLKGYGRVLSRDGLPREDLLLERLTEEHGMLRLLDPSACDLKVGDRLLIVPNHICTVVNLFDQLMVVSHTVEASPGEGLSEATVEGSWAIAARGRVY